MSDLRITVGASLDRSTLAVFSQLADAAKRAAAQVTQAQKAAASAETAEWRKATSALNAMEKEKTREIQREVRKREQAERQAIRDIERDHKQAASNKASIDRQRSHEVLSQLRAQAAEEKRIGEQSRRNRIREQREHAQGQAHMGAMVLGASARAMRFAASVGMDYAHGIGLDTSFGSMVAKNTQLEQHAIWLSNSGYQAGKPGAAGRRQDPQQLIKESFDVGTRTGTSVNDVLEGHREFVKLTGDLETSRAVMEKLATLSKATGSSMEDVAGAAGNIANQLGDVPDKVAAIDEVMRAIAGQGHLGAVEIRDMATQMAKVAAYTRQIETKQGPGGGTAGNMRTLGILAQESRIAGGSSTANQAAQSVLSMYQALSTKATIGHWKETVGQGPYSQDPTQKGKFLDPQKLIELALRKSGMDETGKFAQLFGGAKGLKAVRGFQSIYQEEYTKTAGGAKEKEEAGIAAVNREFERLRTAIIEEDELRTSFAAAMKTQGTVAEQWNNEMQRATMEIQKSLLPVLKDLAPALVQFLQGVSKLLAMLPGEKGSEDYEAAAAGSKGMGIIRKQMARATEEGIVDPEQVAKGAEALRAEQEKINAAKRVAYEKQHVSFLGAAWHNRWGQIAEVGRAFGRGDFQEAAGGAINQINPLGNITSGYKALAGAGGYQESQAAEGAGQEKNLENLQADANKTKESLEAMHALMRGEGIKVRVAKPGEKIAPGADEGEETMPQPE